MAFEIPENLHSDLMPVAWMLGSWEGSGRGDYPDSEPFAYGQQVVFAHDGRSFLHYFARSWIVDAEHAKVREGSLETGFLRRGADDQDKDEHEEGDQWELVLAHDSGLVEVWYGHTDGPRLELVTDLVARTRTAEKVTAGQRLYGLVEGDLMYAYDKATDAHPLRSFTWGRLTRV